VLSLPAGQWEFLSLYRVPPNARLACIAVSRYFPATRKIPERIRHFPSLRSFRGFRLRIADPAIRRRALRILCGYVNGNEKVYSTNRSVHREASRFSRRNPIQMIEIIRSTTKRRALIHATRPRYLVDDALKISRSAATTPDNFPNSLADSDRSIVDATLSLPLSTNNVARVRQQRQSFVSATYEITIRRRSSARAFPTPPNPFTPPPPPSAAPYFFKAF